MQKKHLHIALALGLFVGLGATIFATSGDALQGRFSFSGTRYTRSLAPTASPTKIRRFNNFSATPVNQAGEAVYSLSAHSPSGFHFPENHEEMLNFNITAQDGDIELEGLHFELLLREGEMTYQIELGRGQLYMDGSLVAWAALEFDGDESAFIDLQFADPIEIEEGYSEYFEFFIDNFNLAYTFRTGADDGFQVLVREEEGGDLKLESPVLFY